MGAGRFIWSAGPGSGTEDGLVSGDEKRDEKEGCLLPSRSLDPTIWVVVLVGKCGRLGTGQARGGHLLGVGFTMVAWRMRGVEGVEVGGVTACFSLCLAPTKFGVLGHDFDVITTSHCFR